VPHWWTSVDDVLVSFTIPGPIPDKTWDRFLDAIVTQRPSYCLVLCAGVANVDAAQRRRSTQAVMRTRSSVVVLTDNRLTRGLAMAVAWFGAKLDAFAWNRLSDALERMQISEDTRKRLYETALEFHAEFGHLDR